MRFLDAFIGALLAWPWLTEGFSIAGTEPADLAVPLLGAALIALAVRHLKVTAALLGVAAAVALLFAVAPDFATQLSWHATHRPGAVLVVAGVALLAHRYSGEPWEASFFVRLGKRVGGAWQARFERSPARALWMAAAAVGAALFLVALARHRGFASHGYDLGHFTNTMWNLTHGGGYVSSIKDGANVFADHQSPTFWLLAPLFALVPRPETLLFAQALGLAAGGPALYYLARTRFGANHWAAGALPWLYWAYLPMRNANAFDFHPEAFMLPLFLWAFAAFTFQGGVSRVLGVVALVAALGTKESAPVVAAGIGIAWALAGGGWRGLALAAAGVAVFVFDLKVVPGLVGAADYAYLGHYERFGGGLGALVAAPFTQPAYFFSQVLDGPRLNFLFWTLAPLGFLPLLDWRVAVAALPAYLMLFLSAGDQRVNPIFHYGIEPGTALFWALPFGVAACARRFGWQCTGVWMLAWAVAAFGPGELARPRLYMPAPHAPWLAQEVLPCLDARAPMTATDRLIPHLATRAWIGYPDQLVQRPSGEPVACVVTDLSLGGNWPLGKAGVERLRASLPERGYREAWRCGALAVHERTAGSCLRCVPRCP